MKKKKLIPTVLIFFMCVGVLVILTVVSRPSIGLAVQDDWHQWHPAKNLSYDNPAEVREKIQLRGKTRGNAHPKEAVFGQIFVNTNTGREWIFDGQQWVPHDNTVDAYYEYLETVEKSPPGQDCKVTPPGKRH